MDMQDEVVKFCTEIFSKERYEEMVQEMFERHQSVQSVGFNSGAYKPGLDKMLAFDEALGFPSRQFESIHVAGTNGKGSVCHMLSAALSTGQAVGLYTSPHLVDFRERVRTVRPDGVGLIPEEAVYEFLTDNSDLIDSLELSFFEITTGLAFWWFAKSGVKVAVIETGLGGRLDATNIIMPRLSIITSIGLDHCAILGPDRASIAGEKAGIFKRGVPALVGFQDSETEPVFKKIAEEVGAELHFCETEPTQQVCGAINLDLRGEYQCMNYHTVLSAMRLLNNYYPASFDLISPRVDNTPARDSQRTSAYSGIPREVLGRISNAARLTGLRGRWEKAGSEPDMICDIGHNPPALKLNFAQLRAMMDSGKYDKLIIVYGIMADKALDDILPMMPQNAEYIFCAPDTSRALSPAVLASRFTEYFVSGEYGSVPPYHIADSVAEAVRTARIIATPRSLIYIGGSAFVVAEFLKP